MAIEPLDRRVMLAVTAAFSAGGGGDLRVTGDDQDNVITISRTAGGTILVNNGAVAIQGGTPTVANTGHLHIVGAGGNDAISLNEANGALPGAALFGGAGNDTLIGGSGVDFAEGETGSDSISLGAGDDEFSWNPGDGSDVNDGQGGSDALTFSGSDAAEKFEISDSGSGSPFHRARLTRDVGNVNIDLSGVETINLNTLGGADTITIDEQSATDIFDVNLDLQGTAGTGDNATDSVIINGTNGDDGVQIASFGTLIAIGGLFPFVNITGEDGLDALTVNTLGGNDIVDAANLEATNASQLVALTENGGAGNDTLIGSQGADTFRWNAGDGNDTVDGGDNPDTLIFNGSDASEKFDLSASGSRVRLTRDVGGFVMDLGGIDTITVNALGGADTATVNDLTGTGVTRINLNLAEALGGTAGDRQADSVVINGRNGNDVIPVLGNFVGPNSGVVLVDGGTGVAGGLPYFTVITSTEGDLDVLTVNARGGNDVVDASSLFATNANQLIKLTVNGGTGNDTLRGSPGTDVFVWTAGDGSDNIDGQAGADTLSFIGSAGADSVVFNGGSFSAGGFVVTFTGIETRTFDGHGGGDTLTINGGTVVLPSTQKIASLSIGAGGVLDIRDHGLIVDYAAGGASPIGSFMGSGYTGITGLIARGLIASSFDTTLLTEIGVAEASDVAPGGSFGGLSVDATAVLVKFTYAGDANLDGKINIDDYGHIDTSLGVGRTGWFNGDFNYDGVINIDDYGIIDVNIDIQGPPLTTAAPAVVNPPAAASVSAVTQRINFPGVRWPGSPRERPVKDVFPGT